MGRKMSNVLTKIHKILTIERLMELELCNYFFTCISKDHNLAAQRSGYTDMWYVWHSALDYVFCYCFYTGHALSLSAIIPLFPTFNTWVLPVFLLLSHLMLTLTTLWGCSYFIDQHTKVQRIVMEESEDLSFWLMCHLLAVSSWENRVTF